MGRTILITAVVLWSGAAAAQQQQPAPDAAATDPVAVAVERVRADFEARLVDYDQRIRSLEARVDALDAAKTAAAGTQPPAAAAPAKPPASNWTSRGRDTLSAGHRGRRQGQALRNHVVPRAVTVATLTTMLGRDGSMIRSIIAAAAVLTIAGSSAYAQGETTATQPKIIRENQENPSYRLPTAGKGHAENVFNNVDGSKGSGTTVNINKDVPKDHRREQRRREQARQDKLTHFGRGNDIIGMPFFPRTSGERLI